MTFHSAFRIPLVRRLLRGRLLYVALGLLMAILYARTITFTPRRVFQAEPVSEAAQTESLEWWPTAQETAVFQRAMVQKPHLALALSLVTIGMGGLAVVGLIGFGWALATGRLRTIWHFSSRGVPPWSFGEFGRIMILTVVVASLLPFVRIAALASWLDVHDANLWITTSMVTLDVFVILAILAF
ncbi:MAG: hypothetical protein HYZ91_01515, partial [Candidatus Omnitrophica bacterium]|nr:hypothetical protein [Candidatus Omnitrophota bacterium]